MKIAKPFFFPRYFYLQPVHILVIQTAFIGDAILASALLEALNEQEKVSSISLMVRKGNESLYAGHPFLKRLHVLDKSLPKFKQLSSIIKELRASEYDVVLNCQRFMTTGLITSRSKAAMKIGYDKNPMSWTFDHVIPHEIGDGRHEVDRLMDLLVPLFGKVHALPRLYPSKKDEDKAQWDGDYICMAPSSVWFTKQWPIERWVELIEATDVEKEVLMIGAPGDVEMCDEIIARCSRDRVVNLCGELSLLQSAVLMRGAVMSYVNDSAPLHLCSAMDAPVTAIFCSTIPEFGFGPLSKHSHIAETHHDLSCRPCGLHGKSACPEGHFKCAEIAIDSMVR